MNARMYRVIAGPHRLARRYAKRRGWNEDEYIIVTRGHQLAQLDPSMIAAIITVELHTMARRVIEEIRLEIDRIRVLWPVQTVAA